MEFNGLQWINVKNMRSQSQAAGAGTFCPELELGASGRFTWGQSQSQNAFLEPKPFKFFMTLQSFCYPMRDAGPVTGGSKCGRHKAPIKSEVSSLSVVIKVLQKQT